MTDFFSWCPIHLGRWAGTQVRIHVLFVFFVPLTLLGALLSGGHSAGAARAAAQTAGWLTLMVLAVVLHELGHVAMATWLGSDLDEVRLWPLGNLVGPSQSYASRTTEAIWVAAAGPITSLALALISAISLNFAGATMVFNPFGNSQGTGAPYLASGDPASAEMVVWWIGWFGYLNWILFLANLIPALPMDGGRIFRGILTHPAIGQPKDNTVAPYTAWAVAVLLLLAGLARLLFSSHKEGGGTLIGLAILIYLMVRAEARMAEDGGFFDDGVFGYDFSEGYTSLEAGTQKVRPYRESALKRWRRRRSEMRRQRRQAREAAEERRMDEILSKLHSEGRSSLTDEEQRFLIRVSAKYRSRSKSRD